MNGSGSRNPNIARLGDSLRRIGQSRRAALRARGRRPRARPAGRRRRRRRPSTPRRERDADRASRGTRPRWAARNDRTLMGASRPWSARSPRAAAGASRGRGNRRGRDCHGRIERNQHAVGQRRRCARRAPWLPPCRASPGTMVLRDRGLDPPELVVEFRAGDRDRARRTVRPSAGSADRAASARATPTRCRCPPDNSCGERCRVSRRGQPDQSHQIVDARRDSGVIPPEQARHDGDVVSDGEVWKQSDFLEDVADAGAGARTDSTRRSRDRAPRPRPIPV